MCLISTGGFCGGGAGDAGALEDLWGEARPKPCFGVPAYTLSPEWELLFLAAHAARHQWQTLKWLADIHEVCSGEELEWEKVREKAKRLGWEEVLRLTLNVCHILFGTSVFANGSRSELPRWLKLFPHDPPPQSWRSGLFSLHLLKRPSDKLRYLAHVFLVPTLAERRFMRLPSSLGFLYYPLRPLRLGCKWGWWIVRAAFKRLRRVGKKSFTPLYR
jgi:hypothetical protein